MPLTGRVLFDGGSLAGLANVVNQAANEIYLAFFVLKLALMNEYFTSGIVLSRLPSGEFDESVVLYTKMFGKVRAKATGLRRITSKLSGHLQVGSLVNLRLRKKNSTQLIEAISLRRGLSTDLHRFLGFIDQMVPFESPDAHLWHACEYVLENEVFIQGDKELRDKVYRRLLDVLGFGPRFANCSDCGSNKIAYFLASDIMFLCSNSLGKLGYTPYDLIEI